jgi:hypothetical protein
VSGLSIVTGDPDPSRADAKSIGTMILIHLRQDGIFLASQLHVTRYVRPRHPGFPGREFAGCAGAQPWRGFPACLSCGLRGNVRAVR